MTAAAPLTIACPKCSAPLKANAAIIGKNVKCSDCGHGFVMVDPTRRAMSTAEDSRFIRC